MIREKKHCCACAHRVSYLSQRQIAIKNPRIGFYSENAVALWKFRRISTNEHYFAANSAVCS